ncbi:MAG: response regulator transcription factor [Candidatus Woesebacteria bacterium]|nr:MAG: response regulator transcription factor [Candidatus Woesebacteria bacterium]
MRILVVEDEHRIANTIKKGLTDERYAVDVSYDGTTGFDLASTEDYDLLVLDLLLPGMDGITICKKLRESNVHTPILILTAKGLIRDKIEGLDSGADDYLTKPFSFEELLARIRALTRRPKDFVSNRLEAGDLTLDSKTYEVKRKGKSIILSSREFSLLEYLMRNKGKVVTKNEIINHVWNYDADILPNTVEVYIKNIRSKIDAPFKGDKTLISTVRGFGYKLTYV